MSGFLNDQLYVVSVLESIRDALCDCLEADSIYGRPSDCFISHDKPPEDCCDYLAVWVERWRQTSEFPIEFEEATRCGIIRPMINVQVHLSRNCWPTLKDNPTNPFPSPAEMEAAATKLVVDGQVIWCCLETGAANHAFVPQDEDAPDECWEMKLERMDPTRGGGCVGWLARMVLELPPCC